MVREEDAAHQIDIVELVRLQGNQLGEAARQALAHIVVGDGEIGSSRRGLGVAICGLEIGRSIEKMLCKSLIDLLFLLVEGRFQHL